MCPIEVLVRRGEHIGSRPKIFVPGVLTVDIVPLVYRPEIPNDLNTLSTLAVGGAYWIHMHASADLQVAGRLPSMPFSLELNRGWNYIGLVGEGPLAIADALSSIEGLYSEVRAFDGEGLTYVAGLSDFLQTLTSLDAGVGYMINMLEPAVLTYGREAA